MGGRVNDPSPEAAGRVLLIGGSPRTWDDRIRDLAADGFEVHALQRTVTADEIARRARLEEAVLIVDLDSFLQQGTTIALTCRRQSPGTPVIVITESPSIELAQRIRSTGVFYLALHPVTAEELVGVLRDAFRQLAHGRPAASRCVGVKRVLIVDDDPDFRIAMSAVLESQGYAVSTALCGREGLKKILAEHPDLIVLDVMMEDSSAGYEVTQVLHFASEYRDLRTIPILMVSSIELDPATRFARSEEMPAIVPDAYLTKPVKIPEFLDTVARLVGAPHPAETPHA